MKRQYRDLILVSLLCIVSYHNIFVNEFVWDDHDFMTEAKNLKLSHFSRFFTQESREMYRPFRTVLYMVTHSIWGLNPLGYHINSILIHVSCTILVYLIVDLALRKEEISLMSALLFAAHPIHTESITFISSSFDEFGALFLLLSLYLYIRSEESGDDKNLYILSIAASVLAFLTREITLTLPLLLILYDFCFRSSEEFKIGRYVPYFAAAIFYLFVRFFVLGIGARSGYLMGSLYITALTMSKVFVKYIQLLLLPVNLSVDHYVGVPDSALEPGVLAALVLMFLYFAASFFAFRRSRAVFFCMAWFFVALLPVSNLLVPTRSLMAERHLYLPSIGFCMLIGLVFYNVSTLKRTRNLKKIRSGVYLLFVLMLVSYSTLTLNRNVEWRDDFTLWSKTVETSPNSGRAHLNLGLAYARLGKNSKAIEEYQKSLEINSKDYMAHNNLGIEYIKLEEYDNAIEELHKALALNPELYEARANLGSVFLYQGEFSMSIEEYKKAMELNPDDAKLHSALALAYFYTGQYDLALNEAERAVELEPTNVKYRMDLDFIEKNVSRGG